MSNRDPGFDYRFGYDYPEFPYPYYSEDYDQYQERSPLRRHDVLDPYHYARGMPQVQFYPDHADPFRSHHNYDPRFYPTLKEYEDECYDEWEDEEGHGQVETGGKWLPKNPPGEG
ncbi:hypothetical protein DAPPUDRAFT_342626 [Daphnia pulex]|uniref:Uncharacterized protein n=1 Tax=Daphnia pulex TaxID=6669 RepID=E9I610_DAPPU|nr:hypothetical protein DAPPUDRAFT_342626 [Daphnia pulex]|eukprot:EFX60570.1 hypothetical protein DAPPUDRAFT_342626 [Daphnia pulex]